jgi:hypothetical protein
MNFRKVDMNEFVIFTEYNKVENESRGNKKTDKRFI